MLYRRIFGGPTLLIISAIQILQGFAVYALAGRIPAGAHEGVSIYAPSFAALLVGGGAILLLVFRHRINPVLRQGLILIPALPALVMAWKFLQNGAWPSAVQEGVLAVAILLLPHLPATRDDGIDLASASLGIIQVAVALLWLLTPSRYGPLWLAPAVVAGGLIGAALLLLPAQWRHRVMPNRGLCRFVRVILPLIMIAWSARSGCLVEAVAWSVWTIASIVGDGVPRPRGIDEAEGPEERLLLVQDLALESWNWLLLFLLVALAAFPGISLYSPLRVGLIAVAVSIYNTTIYFLLPRRNPVEYRINTHLVFMVVALGFLVSSTGVLGHGLITLVALAAPLATWARGVRIGHRMLWVSLLLVAIAEAVPWLAGEQDLSTGMVSLAIELLMVAVTGRIGIGLMSAHQALVQQLQESQAEVQQAHRDLTRSEARLSTLLAIAPSANIAIDAEQRIILFNKMAEETFGYTEAEALGQPLDILIPPASLPLHRSLVEKFGQGPVTSKTMGERRDLVGRRKSGELFPVQVAISRVTVEDETIYLAIAQDVTERRATERKLKASEEMFRSAFEYAPIGVGLLTAEGTWLQANHALCEMLGYAESEIVGRQVDDVTYSEDRQIHALDSLIQGEVSSLQLERRFQHKSGRIVWVHQSYSAMKDQAGEVRLIIQVQDITDRKGYEAELIHMANYDPLTELANRRRFRQEVEHQLAGSKQTGEGGALFFIDLDLFKYVNDTLGHQRGDEVLRQTGSLLKRLFRSSDTVARLGGDEFAILLPQTDHEAAIQRAEALLDGLRRTPVPASEASVSLTASVGITFFPEHGMSADELLGNADMAVYEAKEKGRNSWALFTPDGAWKREMESRLSWERRIRDALQNDGFVLHYQPILDLQRNLVTHHEALIRMVGDDGQLIYPGAFLGVAERFGLIQQLDHWVVQKAIRFMGQQRRLGRSQVLEVNLSGKTLTDPDLLPLIQSQLEAAGVNPSDLVFEITETAAISDMDQAERFIHDMKGLGCRFALDDVGAGFSSLYFLKQLPVDYVKIDGAFVRNLPHDVADQHLVRALAMVSRELGKRTIAEFVDAPETLKLIQEYGVDYAQGYLIGRPSPSLHE